MSQLFTSGGQSIGVSASASVFPMNIQDWSPLGWTGWISLQSKGLSRAFSCTTIWKYQFFGTQPSFIVQLSHPYMTTGKTIDLTIQTFLSKTMSLFFNTLSRFVFSNSILGTYQPGKFIFQCYIFLPFHTVHGVLKARILKWFAVPFSSRRSVQETVMRTIPKKKKCKKGKMVVWGSLTNSWEKKRSKGQRQKGKINPVECKVPKNSKER